jgi:cell fate (sporulation/competence/biofilm development) regulator YlbF (YheA/YmcA/DUF963 family)
MPIEPAKHKKLLTSLYELQDKFQELSENGMMKDEALRQLSKHNKHLFCQVKFMISTFNDLQRQYENSIMGSDWVADYDPNTLNKRQVKKAEMKLQSIHHHRCSCGELISLSMGSKGLKQHLRTKKHNDSMIRLHFDMKKEKDKNSIYHKYKVDTIMFLNYHIQSICNNRHRHYRYAPSKFKKNEKHFTYSVSGVTSEGVKKISVPTPLNQSIPPGLVCLEFLIQKWKYNKYG